MPALKPIDYQNIALRLIGMSTCTPEHLATLAHSHRLSVSLTDMRRACDELGDEGLARRLSGNRFELTPLGEICLPHSPLLEGYYIAKEFTHAESV